MNTAVARVIGKTFVGNCKWYNIISMCIILHVTLRICFIIKYQ